MKLYSLLLPISIFLVFALPAPIVPEEIKLQGEAYRQAVEAGEIIVPQEPAPKQDAASPLLVAKKTDIKLQVFSKLFKVFNNIFSFFENFFGFK
jgi:hypothetical protein